MLYGFLVTLYILTCLLLVLLVLIQKGKSSMGLGAMGGGTQMLFGGSGGQDFFQKTTWVLGTLFMVGSLGLGLMKSSASFGARFLKAQKTQSEQQASPQAGQDVLEKSDINELAEALEQNGAQEEAAKVSEASSSEQTQQQSAQTAPETLPKTLPDQVTLAPETTTAIATESAPGSTAEEQSPVAASVKQQ